MDDLDRKIQALYPAYGTNAGHGHVWSRPDGSRARCGGAGLCALCATQAAALAAARRKLSGAAP